MIVGYVYNDDVEWSDDLIDWGIVIMLSIKISILFFPKTKDSLISY